MRDYQLLKFIVTVAVFAAQQLLAFGSGCVNGKWEEDTCVCNEGYETSALITTEPSYCSQQTVVVIHIVNTSPLTHRNVLDITLPLFCVYILGCCCVGVVYTIWQIGMRFWATENLRKLKIEKVEFQKMVKKYNRVKMMDAQMWNLPPMDYSVINSVTGVHILQYKRAKVLLDYKAQDEEELTLKKGDIIMDIIELENGWWQGDLNGQIGYFSGDFVQFLDNTKKTGSAIVLDDPEWIQGIQETAKTLQYKRTDDKKSKKKDEDIVSETSSMYLKDLAGVKKTTDTTPKKWQKKPDDNVTASTTKRKSKHVAATEEERLLISSDSQSISPEYDTIQRKKGKKRKEKDTKEMLVEDSKLSLTEKDSQLFEDKQSKQKKKRSKGTKHRKQTQEKVTGDSKQSLLENDGQISIARQDREKVKGKERKHSEQSKQKKHREKQGKEKQPLLESASQTSVNKQNNERRRGKQKYKKMRLVESDIELSDEILLEESKEEKHSKQKRKDKRTSDRKKTSAVKASESAESVKRTQKKKRKETQPEKQQSNLQSDTSDERPRKKKARESKRKQKKLSSDDELSEIEQPIIDKKLRGKKQAKRSEQKALSASTDTEASIEPRKKSKGNKSRGKQPKRVVTESSSDQPSITISDIEFLTESEEEKSKKGFFKKLFKF